MSSENGHNQGQNIQKRCAHCKVEKSVEDFPKDCRSKKGRRQSYCRGCSNDLKKERGRKLYLEVCAFKVEKGCMDCGYSAHPVALQFDHRPGEVKLGDIARLVYWWGPKKVWAEIAKCDVVCANCHAVRTAERIGFNYAE